MDNIVQVARVNYDLLANIMHQARGNTSLNRFAFQCGYTARVFAGYAHGEKCKTTISPKLYKALLNNADKRACLNEEKLLAVFGTVKETYIEAAYQKFLKQAFKDVKIRRSESVDLTKIIKRLDSMESEKDRNTEKFLDYLDDLSFFLATLTQSEIYQTKKRMYKIYHSPALVAMLSEFHQKAVLGKENGVEQLIDYFKNPSSDKIPHMDKKIVDLHQVLCDLLINF